MAEREIQMHVYAHLVVEQETSMCAQETRGDRRISPRTLM